MKNCSNCKSEIEKKLTKCPHCQKDLRSFFKKNFLLTLILILCLSMSVFYFLVSPQISNESQTQNSKTSQKDLADYNLNIGKHAYNEITGAYRGEIIEAKKCAVAPEIYCYVVNQPTYMRPMEAPADNVIIKDSAP